MQRGVGSRQRVSSLRGHTIFLLIITRREDPLANTISIAEVLACKYSPFQNGRLSNGGGAEDAPVIPRLVQIPDQLVKKNRSDGFTEGDRVNKPKSLKDLEFKNIGESPNQANINKSFLIDTFMADIGRYGGNP